jgi:chromate transport protein ChrA
MAFPMWVLYNTVSMLLKLQPLVVILVGSVAIYLLQKALGYEENIHITRILIVGILTLSYLQSFLIIDSLITRFIREIFSLFFK